MWSSDGLLSGCLTPTCSSSGLLKLYGLLFLAGMVISISTTTFSPGLTTSVSPIVFHSKSKAPLARNTMSGPMMSAFTEYELPERMPSIIDCARKRSRFGT